jgi:hypothetical protein
MIFVTTCVMPHPKPRRLAWLAPDIVEAILDGRQPKALTVKRLLAKLPMDWADQRRALGFEPKTLIS